MQELIPVKCNQNETHKNKKTSKLNPEKKDN